MAKIIDGKKVSAGVRADIAAETAKLREERGLKVGLAVVIVGNNPASRVYVNNKKKACEEVGFQSFEYAMDENTTEEQLLDLITVLNHDDRVNGILVQLPLPKQINEKAIINAIVPEKDVDAFHPVNVGKIMIGDYSFLPCTPAGVMELIASTGTDITGKNCVVVGRSNIVGKPMAMLLLHQNGTVTICHSKTKNLREICLGADILVVAVGKADFVTGDMIKEGAVVIDVGMNRRENGKLCGDVEFESAEKKASYITPVPGGVGPMTITMLMKNTLTAAKQQAGI
ncbi:MAG: bifunctional methylenetetrahydrofolate dehydrogenase/methenyltetrahydrofolate cyclohydrolase FolD [Oscillospiraceae bacterium]|nr:bifunctional methylenetetrahydrofolate dehydrogenase/methenyltetrahydrofolate cyclohydrolase FolD [Oscillospiraceae bacterium]